MIALRSLAFNILFFSWSFLVQTICLPVLLLSPRAVLRVGRFWSKGITALLARVCALRHEIRGLANLPERPCIIAAKHQSAWDTLIFSQLLEAPAYVLKRELVWVPLFGWYIARIGAIAIDRTGGAAALRRMMEQGRRMLRQGRPIVIFPEGTRVAPGARKPYLPGVAALYRQLGVPVVPVTVNSGLFWGRRAFLKKPGLITLEILPPIEPGLDREAFTAELENRIETASARLLAAART
ncbi:MAG: lysophospholipid acyltransferase family protein, partial [Kiloniellaceae bacterium]